jgi:hypothetical protein
LGMSVICHCRIASAIPGRRLHAARLRLLSPPSLYRYVGGSRRRRPAVRTEFRAGRGSKLIGRPPERGDATLTKPDQNNFNPAGSGNPPVNALILS